MDVQRRNSERRRVPADRTQLRVQREGLGPERGWHRTLWPENMRHRGQEARRSMCREASGEDAAEGIVTDFSSQADE